MSLVKFFKCNVCGDPIPEEKKSNAMTVTMNPNQEFSCKVGLYEESQSGFNGHTSHVCAGCIENICKNKSHFTGDK